MPSTATVKSMIISCPGPGFGKGVRQIWRWNSRKLVFKWGPGSGVCRKKSPEADDLLHITLHWCTLKERKTVFWSHMVAVTDLQRVSVTCDVCDGWVDEPVADCSRLWVQWWDQGMPPPSTLLSPLYWSHHHCPLHPVHLMDSLYRINSYT